MYKLVTREGEAVAVRTTEGQPIKVIPFNPDNTDYQEYLKWLAEGNEPEPADQPE